MAQNKPYPSCYFDVNGIPVVGYSAGQFNNWLPCGVNGTSRPFVNCCVAGDMCMSNNLCHYTHSQLNGSYYYVAGCTDITKQDSSCFLRCSNSNPDAIYDSVADIWKCCGATNKNAPNCYVMGSQPPWKAPAPADLSTVVSLPVKSLYTSWYDQLLLQAQTATNTVSGSATATSTPTTSASATTAPSSSSSSSSSTLSSGASAGIGVGATLAVLCLAVIAFFFFKRRRQKYNSLQMLQEDDEWHNGKDAQLIPEDQAPGRGTFELNQPKVFHETYAERRVQEVSGEGPLESPFELGGNGKT